MFDPLLCSRGIGPIEVKPLNPYYVHCVGKKGRVRKTSNADQNHDT